MKIVGSGFASHYFDMRKNPRWILFTFFNLLFCVLSVSCGKGYEDDEKDQRQEEVAAAQFEAQLNPLNSQIGSYSGILRITIDDNQFWARLSLNGPYTGSMNQQYIHMGGRCPTMSDDLNGDRYVDFKEAHNVLGDMLIPLDSILETQMKGMGNFPKLKKKNSYYYTEATSFSRMMDDLRDVDPFPNDKISKLSRREGLDLDRRVVVVYGVSDERRLPASVESYDGFPTQTTLPIACGEIIETY